MFTIKKLTFALIAAVSAAVVLSATPSQAAGGACNQQGRQVKIDGVWHKIVAVRVGLKLVYRDCGPAW